MFNFRVSPRCLGIASFTKGSVNTRDRVGFLESMSKDFALEFSFEYLDRPVVYFRKGDPYEFFVFKKSEFLAWRYSDCDCLGFDFQLIDDRGLHLRMASGRAAFRG